LDPSYEAESADDNELRGYLRRIAYWIGCFNIEFNQLEDMVVKILELNLNGGDIRGYEYIFISGLSFNEKVNLLERLYKYHQNFVRSSEAVAQVENVIKMIGELKELGNLRNMVVHANYYSLDKNGNVRVRTKFAESDAEEYWLAINRDILVDGINRITELSEKLEEIDELLF
jgi:hypothetical protein